MVSFSEASDSKREPRKRCGLCGKTKNLIKTWCCGNWICDDEHKYVAFSYARNSCHRNHRKQTLCAYHYESGHSGNWWECETCRDDFSTAEYVAFGTNEYNFRKLENPPSFKPIRCDKCKTVIDLAKDGFTQTGGDRYVCEKCSSWPV